MKKTLLTLTIFLMSVNWCFSGEVKISWDANQEPDLMGYRVHFSTDSTNLSTIVDVNNNTSYIIGGIQNNVKYFFSVTAYDSLRNESEYSKIVNYLNGKISIVTGVKVTKEKTELKY